MNIQSLVEKHIEEIVAHAEVNVKVTDDLEDARIGFNMDLEYLADSYEVEDFDAFRNTCHANERVVALLY